jgi:L-glutamine:2-deoxy-scyllo-inosose/3-amino-2,3-dideoxy-scyllo-inosose aminotransferase
LNACPLYRPHTKRRYHWDEAYWRDIDPKRFDLPVCNHIYRRESVNFHHTLLMASTEAMDHVVEAIEKIRAHLPQLKKKVETAS